MYKCIIFDVDGTLIDTRDVCYESIKEFIINEKLPMPNEDLLNEFFGLSTKACFSLLGLNEGCESEMKKWVEIYEKYSYLTKVYDNIPNILKELKDMNIKLGIVTSRTYNELYTDNCFITISDFFDYIIAYDDTKFHKPNPEPLISFLKKSGYKKEDCIFIGDTAVDIECAQKANVDFALASWGAIMPSDYKIKRLLKVYDILSLIKQ